jgi:galactose mutarotase-like enzyme
MNVTLANEQLTVVIASLGAELQSISRNSDGREYLWQADPKYWIRRSPILFPFVGASKNKEYRYEGKTYPMEQHGFARDMEFTVESETGNEVWFVLESNEESYAKYPFRFRLHIGYELKANDVIVKWKVENIDDKIMYFSIGAHPGFNCPINGEADKLGYGLKFGGLTDSIHHHGNSADGMAVMDDEVLALEDGSVRFTQGFFDKCTYMVEGKQTGEVSLIDKAGEPYVTVTFDTPLFAVWSPEGKDAPFVCIEPWFGRCDTADFTGEISEKDFENSLPAGEKFEAEYKITLLV